jgi:acyl transferase domain-containing protein/NAD(P)H-dependent flavin oxidoreductase YrpB (nitropropane dioxygenase family)
LKTELLILTPFETPDVKLALSAARAGALAVLHLGREREAGEAALDELARQLHGPFGVCLADETMAGIALPAQVSHVVLPWGLAAPKGTKAKLLWQVRSVAEALEALKAKARPQALILKGSEGAGACGGESTFLLFQSLIGRCREAGVAVYLQGGAGVHSTAAYLALGAQGVVLDSQVALFPECSAPDELKASIGRLSGSELREVEGFRYFLRPGADGPGEGATLADLLPRLGTTEGCDCVALGQDAILAADYAGTYRRLRGLIKALRTTAFSHLRIAQTRGFLAAGDAMSEYLGTRYPLAQGPMARISDVPEFLRKVADGGALPFLAMSMMTGDAAKKALSDTAAALEDKAWGVGILGFAYPKMVDEQTRLICEAKPPVVLIAGGRPSLAKPFEQEGIKTFLHVPAAGLLEMFLKEGSRSFIFEGRESGGHVGPLFSTVLWEKQMNRLLSFEEPASLSLLFAGGIHDELSAAFVRIMTAPLAARDVRVGIIAGTAYLFTEEIVESGAITEDYRRLLVEGDRTLLLRSGRGQETRSVPSPFTDFFLSERQRMLAEGQDSTQVLMKLEDLNLGRLRIASKGIERVGDELVLLPVEEQLEKGLYMTGAVTPLINEVTTIARLHERLIDRSHALVDTLPLPGDAADEAAGAATAEGPAAGTQPTELPPIAIVGMAGVFPDAADIDEYWRNILFGKNSIKEVPPERWSAELFYDPNTKDTDHVVSKWGGFIDTVDFDALEFGITPQSLAAIEPVQLLSLLVTKRAFEDAGYDDPSTVDLENTSVVFGAQGAGELATAYGFRAGLRHLFGELTEELSEALPRMTEDSFPGVLSNVITGRISNRLNTGGRNFTVDAACASSLAALDIAVGELASHRADMVVLGGADAHNSIGDFLMFSSTFALSKRGYCATFDKDADGITLGEGVGVLLLKRLEDARRDGNKVYAVIRGVGGSSDGKQLGLTAPSRRGQVKALEEAFASSGIRPSDVGLVEAHGTGTMVGDRIELSALTDVFLEDGTPTGRAQLGSVKTQIGHTKCAAGAAGLIKAALSVQHGLRPATLNLTEPNGAYARSGPFYFRTEKTGLWSEDRRIAGVSGFGFGGTNFHALLENDTAERPEVTLKAWPSELFVFRGETPADAHALMEKLVALCAVNNRFRLRDIAYSLSRKGEGSPVQYTIVAGSIDELLARIGTVLDGTPGEGVYPLKPVEGKVAFLFPGQGSQRVDMAADLFVVFPRMRRLLKAHPEYERILFPPAAFTPAEKKAQREAITSTRNAQPLLGLVDFGIAELLRGFGVEADMAAGHSYGELPALSFAGALDPDELLALSRARADAILDAAPADPGGMAAVSTDRETLDGLLEDAGDIWAVNLNAPLQTVVAGSTEALGAFLKKLDEAGIGYSELNVACAFHSPLLAGADDGFAKALANVKLSKPTLPVWSNTTAEPYPQTAAGIKKRLAEHLVKPVRFTDEVERMYADGARIFIETGPGGVLIGLTDKILKGQTTVSIQIEKRGAEGLTKLLHGLALYLSSGRELDFEKLFEGRDASMLDVDEPENYRKKGTVWNVNGHRAVPENGKLPSHAGSLDGIASLSGGRLALRPEYANASPEQIMMSYLDNMSEMIQDQRDVMLGYLGQADAAPRAPRAARSFAVGTPASNLPAGTPLEVTPVVIGEDDATADGDGGGLPSILALSTEEVMDIILAVVSEKTGYPIDMLDFDANLEADLSIDSIKKMEIVGGLRERATFPENDDDDMEESFEKLISIKTLQEMLDWIQGLEESTAKDEAAEFTGVTATADAAALQAAPDNTAAVDAADGSADSTRINRMILTRQAAPALKAEPGILEGKAFAVTDDGSGLASATAEALAQHGATATLITAEASDLSGFDGLILINAAASTAHYTTLELFALLKRADWEKLTWVYTFDDSVGELLTTGDLGRIDLLEGFTGLIKTLKHEHNDKRLSAVSFYTPIEAKGFAALVAGELSEAQPFPEVFYDGAERFFMLPVIEELAAEDTEGAAGPEDEGAGAEAGGLDLDASSHVLVLGGAQGITPTLVARFAKRYPCNYILVGRSAPALESDDYAQLKSVDEIRNYLIGTEGMKQPREIERKAREIFKTNQIRHAIGLIEAAGATASYRNADVRDDAALRGLIGELRQEYGAIDGVIHAAGILEDKLFRNKEAESFARVYGTKVDPLKPVIDELADGLKLLVMFSSVSSTFGNVGQCDYAAGNSVMDSLARVLAHHRPEIRTVAFCWGPWKGAGMVNTGLEQEFRRRGVAFLELEEGSGFFADELTRGDGNVVVALAGDGQAMVDQLFAAIPHEDALSV